MSKYLYINSDNVITQSDNPPVGFNEIEEMNKGTLSVFKYENNQYFECIPTTSAWKSIETWSKKRPHYGDD